MHCFLFLMFLVNTNLFGTETELEWPAYVNKNKITSCTCVKFYDKDSEY